MEQRLGLTPPSQDEATARLIESAEFLGIEIDREGAERWIAAMSAESFGNITVDASTGVYGHRVTMADHDPGELGRFRRMAAIVGLEDRPPVLMTALALSGSASQSRIHRFPADADFFERIHIRADTRAEACHILSDAIRAKALATLRGEGYRLQEVKFGTWPAGGPGRINQPVTWTPAQVEAGTICFRREDGSQAELAWEEAALEPGWCKLDWVTADPTDKALANVSNVLDPTWEAPDGTITPLDGFLESDSVPLYSHLANESGADSVADYVERLTEEVYKYTVKEPNHGKAARRMYNIFRLTGRYPEAAYIRELFDEPVTALYQVAALLRALDDAADVGDAFGTDTLVAQVDQLIMSAIAALEGPAESEMVRRLLRLRDAVSSRESQIDRTDDFVGVRDDALRAVNDYFERVLTAVPSIKSYLDSVSATRRTTEAGSGQ